MMEWTDRHCRVFLRAITKRTLLYTEMVHTGAILRGDAGRHLGHDPVEHPLALQLGGSDPADLAAAARMGRDYGYDEINLNVGCPSERVSAGRFGACLMAEPELVADCVAAMAEAVDIPVTVKSRIGIDDRDSYEELAAFVETVVGAGLPDLRNPCTQGFAVGPEPEAEPRGSAAAIRNGPAYLAGISPSWRSS